MPGAYTHITLVNVAREPAKIAAGPGLPDEVALALAKHFKFCELGAVSPDYPYLALGAPDNRWADLMHYQATGQMVSAGVGAVQRLSGTAQQKALAWLLGYAAHVVTDATIHPVVELKVGTYADHKTAHRICEMNQDAYIFQRLKLGEIGLSEHLSSGIAACATAEGDLDPAISSTWKTMLQECHAEEFADNPPDISMWHRKFDRMVNRIAEEGHRLLPLARHVAVDCGLTYPAAPAIDHAEYIDGLATPYGAMTYDQVFDKAVTHVIEAWHLIGEGMCQGNPTYQTAFGEWNLDTGRDASDTIVLWA